MVAPSSGAKDSEDRPRLLSVALSPPFPISYENEPKMNRRGKASIPRLVFAMSLRALCCPALTYKIELPVSAAGGPGGAAAALHGQNSESLACSLRTITAVTVL